MTVPAVTPIYCPNYWDKVSADDLPCGVNYCTFDAAVKSGPARAAKWLQWAVNAPADGVVGSETLEAVRALLASTIINRMCDDRVGFLRTCRRGAPSARAGAAAWGIRKEALGSASAANSAPPPPDIEPPPVPVTQPAQPSGCFAALADLLKRIFA